MRLRQLPNGDVHFFDGRGRRETFQWHGGPTEFRSPPGRFAGLHRHSSGYTLTTRSGERYDFDLFGRLTSTSDLFRTAEDKGNLIELDYDRTSRLVAVSVHEESMKLEYDTAGRLRTLTDPYGRQVDYGYDAQGRLTPIQSPPVALEKGGVEKRLVTTYAYEDPGTGTVRVLNRRDNLSSITNPRGKTWLELVWKDGEGERGLELDNQTWGGGTLMLSFEDGLEGRKATITDRRSKIHVWEHNAEGHARLYRDPSGREMSWKYGAYPDMEHGLLTEVESPSSRKMAYKYVEALKPPGQARNVLALPDVARVSAIPGGGEAASFSPGCELDPAHNGSGSEIANGYANYHPRTHQPLEVTLPKGGEIALDLDPDAGFYRGQTTKVREDENSSTFQQKSETVTPDVWGRVVEMVFGGTDAPALTNTFKFGNLLSPRPSSGTLDKGGEQEQEVVFGYDPYWYLRSIEEPGIEADTTVLHETEHNSLGWLLEDCRDVGSGRNNACTRYKYDENGNVVELVPPDGENGVSTLTVYEYGELDELKLTTTTAQPGNQVITEERRYNENYDVRWINATGRFPVRIEYNGRNLPAMRIVETSEGELEETFIYNADGQMSIYIDATQGQWKTYYDGYGRPMLSVDPLEHQTVTVYDASGHPRQRRACDTEKLLATTVLIHDSAGRLVLETAKGLQGEGDLTTAYIYDGRSRLRLIADPRGKLYQFDYDAFGRETKFEASEPGELPPVVYTREVTEKDPRGNPTRITETGSPLVPGIPATLTRGIEYDHLDRPRAFLAEVDGVTLRAEVGYDKRGNVIRNTPPGGTPFTTTFTYDGLDRPKTITRPSGIDVTYEYVDAATSSQVTLVDALQNRTTFTYEGRGLLSSVGYPDATSESYVYDASGRLDSETRPDQTLVDHILDDAGRLVGRLIQFPPGQGAGHTAEGFGYDGLNRMVRAQHGNVRTDLGFDTLSRQISDGLSSTVFSSATVSYEFDGAGNPSLIDYPSSLSVTQQWTAFDRLRSQEIFDDGMSVLNSDFRWQGALRGPSDIGAHAVTRSYDEAQRLSNLRFWASDTQVHQETLWRDERGRLTGRALQDRNGLGWSMSYDDADRLTGASISDFAEDGSEVAGDQLLTSVPTSFTFLLDEAENLTRIEETLTCEERSTELPLDSTGRNRPDLVGTQDLDWDVNGNLIAKGDLRFTYDYLNRLIAVERQEDPNTKTLVASYTYDAFNRRVRREIGGASYITVWDGWRPIEERRGSQMIRRQVFGPGLDEMTRFEVLKDGDTELTVYTPVYDAIGNVVAMLDDTGKPVERYEYSPLGRRFIWSDITPPTIDQVRRIDGQLVVEFSEEIREDQLGTFSLWNVTKERTVPVAYEFTVTTGRRARHRLVITPEPAQPQDLEDDDALELRIPASALLDLFGNRPPSDPAPVALTWSATGTELVRDTAAPKLVEACIKNGNLQLVFSETPDEAQGTSQLLIDGATATWALLTDGYTLELVDALGAGDHTLTFGSGPFDLAGKGIADPPTPPLTIDGSAIQKHIWGTFPGEIKENEPDPERPSIGNPFGFHGLPSDPETGFVYMRNRYYDPEMGRFVTTDPLGYADAPNLYQFALNDPINNSDPSGEIVFTALALGALFYVTADQAIDRFDQLTDIDPTTNFALTGLKAAGLGVSDTVGTTGLYEGLSGEEVLTERRLGTGERWLRGSLGGVQLGLTAFGVGGLRVPASGHVPRMRINLVSSRSMGGPVQVRGPWLAAPVSRVRDLAAGRFAAASRGGQLFQPARSLGAAGNKLQQQLASLGNKAYGAKGKQASSLLQRMARKAGLEVRSGGKHLKVINPETGGTVTVIPHSPHARGTIKGIAEAIMREAGF